MSGVCAAHFARSFKDACGVPPHRYLLTRRVERAKTTLRDTDLPIVDIAYVIGWDSPGSFGRTFRDVTGESPTAARTRTRSETHHLAVIPPCFLSAAHRPDLRMSVSEMRRRGDGGMEEPS